MQTAKISSQNRIAIITSFLLLAFVIVIVVARLLADRMPVVHIPPPPPMPVSNARANYCRASDIVYNLMKIVTTEERKSKSKSLSQKSKQVDFSYDLLRAANLNFPDKMRLPLTERLRIVKLAAPAMRELHIGFLYPYQTYFPHYIPREYGWHNSRLLPQYLAFEGRTRADNGDWNGAMNCYLDAIHLGKDMAKGASMSESNDGIEREMMGRCNAWHAIEHLSPGETRSALQRLQTIIADEVPYPIIMRKEKCAAQAVLLTVFRDPNWCTDIKQVPQKWRDQLQAHNLYDQAESIQTWFNGFISKQQSMDNMTQFFDHLLTEAEKPYPLRHSVTLPRDVVCKKFLFCDYQEAGFLFTSNQALNNLFLLTIALHAYHQDHHSYPDNLQQLLVLNCKSSR